MRLEVGLKSQSKACIFIGGQIDLNNGFVSGENIKLCKYYVKLTIYPCKLAKVYNFH